MNNQQQTKALEIAVAALTRIAKGDVCISYEYDLTPTEKEVAERALKEIGALQTDTLEKKQEAEEARRIVEDLLLKHGICYASAFDNFDWFQPNAKAEAIKRAVALVDIVEAVFGES